MVWAMRLQPRTEKMSIIVMWSHTESYGVIGSHTESYGVIQSHAESYGVMRSHMESYRVIWSRTESCGIIWRHAESHKVIRSHVESYGVILDQIKLCRESCCHRWILPIITGSTAAAELIWRSNDRSQLDQMINETWTIRKDKIPSFDSKHFFQTV